MLLPALALRDEADANSQVGSWSPVYPWPDVSIHLHLLPDGKVFTFSDDDHEEYEENGARHEGFTKAWVMDVPPSGAPSEVGFVPNSRTNLFCSGHAHLPDGRLLIMGGHKGQDGYGDVETSILEYRNNYIWMSGQDMSAGRWYPTATTLANGEVLTVSGTMDLASNPNRLPEVWQTNLGGGWRPLSNALRTLPLYPFMHVAPDGRVFFSGPWRESRYLNTSGTGAWSSLTANKIFPRERYYGSAVQYDDGKIIVIGGAYTPPTRTCEIINLNVGSPSWTNTDSMEFARVQMNATLLADGTILATGGSQASGFNVNTGAVLPAEIWDPATGLWTTVASMQVPRLYHSCALLLPDGRVLSSGGGRPAASGGGANNENAEIYSPPYLFKGARPTITSAPQVMSLGTTGFIQTPDGNSIAKVNLIRIGTVTHAFNQGQRINRLTFQVVPGGVEIQVPSSANLCPPGHYLLFLVNDNGVPSIAPIVQVLPSGPVGVGEGAATELLDFIRLRSSNPKRGGAARIAFGLSKAERARVEVLDLQGRRVRTLADGMFDAGQEHALTWDGLDDAGHAAADGVYWYRLVTPTVTRQGKIALLSR